MNTKIKYSIKLGPTGSSGPVGVTGIPDKRWIRMIKIRKILELWK